MLVCAGLVAGMLALAGVQGDGGESAAPAPEPAETSAPPAPEQSPATTPPETGTSTAAPDTTEPPPEPPPEPALAGDPAAGKALFAGDGGCGACHVLADAGTSGALGPNLDESRPSYELVIERVTHGQGGMPAFGDDGILSEAQIQDLAAYIAQATSAQ